MPSPPASPAPQRPLSAMVRPSPRSSSRMSSSSKAGGGSRASDEDGKTSVRVAVRVRPSLKPTDPGYDLVPQRFQRPIVQVMSDTTLAIEAPQGRKVFVFDRIFSPDTDQAGIWEYLEDCVASFTAGYNVSLLAYGQSGAGKSFTMGTSGPDEQNDPDIMGVVPRAATALFEKLDGPKANPNRASMSQLRAPSRVSTQLSGPKGTKNWTLKATYVEIYNEQLRDLLLPDHIPPNERSPVTIREDTKGNILLTGLRQVELHTAEDLLNALNFGSNVRQTDATAINARSSRSHAVFSLNLVQKKPGVTAPHDKRHSMPLEGMTGTETWTTTDSKMHFVDLAGSERLKNTHAEGARAKEGISINAGLAALGKVISQLSSRNAGAHVSYRDSKLTRLLQDSLGGNAITYMIACVTTPEFHLSETLNTVQYAQRARAIQSKPRIQQVDDGADKQAIIDRLKAEVAFLREQVRNTDRNGNERRPSRERTERSNEKEVELQNQLLDAQENYGSLSQRHAKLIAELAKARDTEHAENAQLAESAGESATERLKRSNNFAQAVEQVVLEYEKTIQALEQSLSSTRGTLHNTETNLLERETKCAYVETLNTQLQARLQKLMDREASTENYLHDLESKLDGRNSGEEKNATIVGELRKEIARVRENEAAAEDYISTLEERLAEADQDSELMQREIDRLEQVVERQRSLGKLDSLLYELDNMQKDTPETETEAPAASHVQRSSRTFSTNSRSQSRNGRQSQLEGTIHETREEDIPEEDAAPASTEEDQQDGKPPSAHHVSEPESHSGGLRRMSSRQSTMTQDQLENVTQELLDLQAEHQGTLTQYELLHSKYEEALRNMADMQDAIDEARHPSRVRDSMLSVTSPSETQTRPSSFLSEPRSGHTKDSEQLLSARSLSSELSSAMDASTTPCVEISDTDTARPKSDADLPVPTEQPSETSSHDATAADDKATTSDDLALELSQLRTWAVEKEAAEKELAEKYAELEKEHHSTLDMLEELKTEVAKARHWLEPPSPRAISPVIRRKSSQNVMNLDRAHRSFALLRSIAAENFEENPDLMQTFELSLSAIVHELTSRSERIQELEADATSAKKEMETKMQIITGLTRERSSLKASATDMSIVSSLRNQLESHEEQLHQMQEAQAARERELLAQVETLQASLEANNKALMHKAEGGSTAERATTTGGDDDKISNLQSELQDWRAKHEAALAAMEATEKQMRSTITELETQLATVSTQLQDSSASTPIDQQGSGVFHEAGAKSHELMSTLHNEIDHYKGIIDNHFAKVTQLEQAHAAARQELEDAHRAREVAAAEAHEHKRQIEGHLRELDEVRAEAQQNRSEAEAHKHDAETQRELISTLENQISSHERAIKTHQQSMEVLKSSHAKQVDDLHTSQEAKIAAVKDEHARTAKRLEGELAEAREELMKVATQVAFAVGLDVSVELISERIEDLIADQKALSEEQKKTAELEQAVHEISSVNESLVQDLESVKSTLSDILMEDGGEMRSPYPTVTEQASTVKRKMVDLRSNNKKNSRLVDELEEQLQSNFDQVHATNNRLSALHERNVQLEEALSAKSSLQHQLEVVKQEKAALEARLINSTDTLGRSESMNGTIRKTSSVTSLPSPPPAIPLPPLPGNLGGSNSSGTTSPTPGMRPPSKDITMQQIQEDQEARIRTIEKHLSAEKQLTSTLEEALTDLERQSNKVKADCDAWRRRCGDLEAELKELKDKPQQDQRWSVHQFEEERKKREAAERARAHLEERMNAINKKKKKGSLNCF
ncbi:hypothetical protein BD289DRAFT_137333 [Coniella lustricola]|uniref:Kinesin motor domain-containing protein n=1 Tax=Coniella lustricola TaxID=2025994 RepID=A0A2T2ZVM3_9PEZI|nr:hypothetical protein BD289DRAFT_137333 [Coniella lustricola]